MFRFKTCALILWAVFFCGQPAFASDLQGRQVKLKTDTFDKKLTSSVDDVQKLAEAVDELPSATYADANARAAISETITGIDYSSSTGVFSTTTGYGIPTTAKQSNWDTAYSWGNHAGLYLGATAKASDSDLLDGHDTAYFQVAGSYLTAETDPSFSSWASSNDHHANWDTAYGWGNHASAGYMTSLSGKTTDDLSQGSTNKYADTTKEGHGETAYGWGNHASAGYASAASVHSVISGGTTGQVLKKKSDTDYDLEWGTGGSSMIYPDAGIALSTGSAWGTSITNNSSNWNTAYGWGNHASAGYFKVDASNGPVTGNLYSTGLVGSISGTANYSAIIAGTYVGYPASYTSIDSTHSGSGTDLPIRFMIGGVPMWTLTTGGDLLSGTDGSATYDITTKGDITCGAFRAPPSQDLQVIAYPGYFAKYSNHIRPDSDNTYDLGYDNGSGFEFYWRNLYVNTNISTAARRVATAYITTTNTGTLKILETGTSPSKYSIFQGGDQTADITYTLPTALGSAGSVLKDVAGNGVLSWGAGGAGGGFTTIGDVTSGTAAFDGTAGSLLKGVNAATSSNAVGGTLTITGGNGDGSNDGGALEILGGLAGATGNGGNIYIGSNNAGGSSTVGDGGTFDIFTGNGHGAGNGGLMEITTGEGGDTGNGGDLTITAGAGGATSGSGGNIEVHAGDASVEDYNGGSIHLTAGGGGGGSGVDGTVLLETAGGKAIELYNNGSIKVNGEFGEAGSVLMSGGSSGEAVFKKHKTVTIKCIGESDALSTGDGKRYFTVPSDMGFLLLVDAQAAVYTASSSGGVSIAIYNTTDSVDMLSTNITIDESGLTSYAAENPSVIDTTNWHHQIETGDQIRVDVDSAGTGVTGLDVILTFESDPSN